MGCVRCGVEVIWLVGHTAYAYASFCCCDDDKDRSEEAGLDKGLFRKESTVLYYSLTVQC